MLNNIFSNKLQKFGVVMPLLYWVIKNFKLFIFSACLSMLFSGCSSFYYLSDPFCAIPNYHIVDNRVHRGGFPKKTGFKVLKTHNRIKSILSLRGFDDKSIAEHDFALKNNLSFFSIPLSVYKQPTENNVKQFLNIVLNPDNQPVFVHCTSGRDRTGAMIALYRVVVYGWGPKEAYKEAKKLGFWPYKGKEALKTFIHQLKDHPEYCTYAKELINLYEKK